MCFVSKSSSRFIDVNIFSASTTIPRSLLISSFSPLLICEMWDTNEWLQVRHGSIKVSNGWARSAFDVFILCCEGVFHPLHSQLSAFKII